MKTPEIIKIHKGEFYLMDEPTTKYNGILTMFEKGNALLELFGSFDTVSPAVAATDYTIWGQSHEGITLSLLSCTRKQRKIRFGVSDIDKWDITFVLTGAHIEDRLPQL
jgi:hypothetical protein